MNTFTVKCEPSVNDVAGMIAPRDGRRYVGTSVPCLIYYQLATAAAKIEVDGCIHFKSHPWTARHRS